MYKKINWKKMHGKNYDGSCCYCGDHCTNEASIKEWRKANENYDTAQCQNDTQKIRYYSRRMSDLYNFVMN